MQRQIYVNLPVANLQASSRFFEQLGLSRNPQYSNESAVCIVFSDTIFAMLLEKEFFKTFTPNAIADGNVATEAIVCFSCESREHVDGLIDRAVSLGGREIGRAQDHGFMYARSFQDLDGHIWEPIHLEEDPGRPS